MYKALWIDDEYHQLEAIKEDFIGFDIMTYGITNSKDAIEEIKNNYFKYDAIILDGKFLIDNETDSTIDDTAFGFVAKEIEKLADAGKITPWYIYSGQPSFVEEKNSVVELFNNPFSKGKIFDKNSKSDFNILCKLIKTNAHQIDAIKIRRQYNEAFEVCSQKYIGQEAYQVLYEIVQSIYKVDSELQDKLYFTQIRIILEKLFRASNKHGILDDKCVGKHSDGKVNLSESCLFMSGIPTKYLGVIPLKAHFPKIIAHNVKNILFVTGAASHTSDPEIDKNLNLSEYRKSIKTNFLLYSLLFQLMDVLIWFKNYIDKRDLNPSEVVGRLEIDSDGNYHIGDCILPYNYVKLHFREGQSIRVSNITNNTSAGTNLKYPNFGGHVQKL
jgi:hypothetical protein